MKRKKKKSFEKVNVLLNASIRKYAVRRKIGDYYYEDEIWAYSYEEAEEIAERIGGSVVGRIDKVIEAEESVMSSLCGTCEEDEGNVEEEVKLYAVCRFIDGFQVYDRIAAKDYEEAEVIAGEIGGLAVTDPRESDFRYADVVNGIKKVNNVYWFVLLPERCACV